MDIIPFSSLSSSSSSSSSCCCYGIQRDVIPEILCRLPVASLLRFRSVTKSWRDLIDSKDFRKQHLNHSVKSNAYMKLMILDIYTTLFSIDLGVVEQQRPISLDSHVLNNYPPFSLFNAYELLGSCNGLLCLRNRETTLVLNPSTMRYQYMPRIDRPIPPPFVSRTIFGFGYDDVNDDYKLVMIVGTGNIDSLEDEDYVVHVYSLKSDSWRIIEQVISYPFPNVKRCGKFVGGALHWVLSPRNELNKIVAFDVATEVFREVRTPMISYDAYCRVDVLGGKLCFVCEYRLASPSYMEIWVMKEYGVESSWTKLVSLDTDSYIDESVPLAYSKCGKKLLLQRRTNLRWYDLQDKGNSYVEFTRGFSFINPYVLVESLVHLKHIINTSAAPAPAPKRKRELLL